MKVLGASVALRDGILIHGSLGSFLIGKGLPFTVYRHRNRVAAPCSICLNRFLLRRVRLRFLNMQPLHHNVIGQAVFIPRIDRLCLCCNFRLCRFFLNRPEQMRVALILTEIFFKLFPVDAFMAPGVRAGVNADIQLTDIADGAGDLPVSKRQRDRIAHLIGRYALQVNRLQLCWLMGESVQLLLIQGAEKHRGLIPGHRASGIVFVLDVHLQAGRVSIVIRSFAGDKLHRSIAARKHI